MITNKRILIIAWAFHPSIGGMEEESFILARAFIKMGYDVDVWTESLDALAKPVEEYQGINIYRINYQKERRLINFLGLMWDYLNLSLKISKQYDFAVIRGALTFEPVFIGFLKYLGLFKARTFVTADTGGENDEIIMVKRSVLRGLITMFCSSHNYLNSICEDNYKHYQELGFQKSKLTRIGNGIEVPKNRPRLIKKVRNFMYLGRFYPYKGIWELLEAFKIVSKENQSSHLYMGGDGPEMEKVKRFITKNSLESRVTLTGFVSRENKEEFFRNADCLVLPSYSEAFSLVVYEALLRGKKVIVTDVADIKRNLGEMVNYCRIKDSKNLAIKMLEVLKSKEKECEYKEISNIVDIDLKAKEICSLFATGTPSP